MAPRTRQSSRNEQADTEHIRVQHHLNGQVITILALKTWDDRDPNRNWMTKACATKLGFSTSLNPGSTMKTIKPIWLLPLTQTGTTYHDDDFLLVDTALQDIVFGKSVSDRIVAAKRQSPGLAVHIRWVDEIHASLAVSAAA